MNNESTHIFIQHHVSTDYQSITLDQVIKRKAMRRRRVAKRLLQRAPLFAVEEMQSEFPGYTYEQFESDVLRKTRKGKRFRRPKKKGFDWKTIREQIPEFFIRCKKRTKTKAVLHGTMKDGTQFTCIVRSVWLSDYGERKMQTHELINLWRGPLKTFLSHPAMLLYEHINKIEPPLPTTT